MITYHGLVSGAEKKDLLKQCNIFVLLTRYPKEGQPISILEAMGNAMVVITTNHAGIPDIVANETNGLVMNKNNFHLDDIYKYITMLYERRSSMIEVCNRNYITATTSYTEHQYVDKMDKVFKAVLAMR
ncbi:MAG: glycosyltransferase [Prevotella sp.]|nr:glycosyltransferase [Prevotella sp.]